MTDAAPAPLPDDALTAKEVAALCGRPLEWVESRLGQAPWPTYQRSSDGRRWVTLSDARVWVELSDQERHRVADATPSAGFTALDDRWAKRFDT
jgi:hypothetical protein